jgi:hypothetical protein
MRASILILLFGSVFYTACTKEKESPASRPVSPVGSKQDSASSVAKPTVLPDAVCGTYVVSGFEDYWQSGESTESYHYILTNVNLIVSKVNDSLISVTLPDTLTVLTPSKYYPNTQSAGSYLFAVYYGSVQQEIDFP